MESILITEYVHREITFLPLNFDIVHLHVFLVIDSLAGENKKTPPPPTVQ